MPIGKLGPTKIYLSYSVLVAAAVLAIVIASAASRQGNADLPMTACVATGIWISGWFVQLLVHLSCAGFVQTRLDLVTLGFLGVETRPRVWTARQTLVISAATCISLIAVAGGFFLLAAEPRWRLPAIELYSSDSIWHAVAWLFGLQAICQFFPLPRTLGRSLLVGLIAHSMPHSDEATLTSMVRRVLLCTAIVSAVAAVALISAESPTLSFPRWPLLSLLAILLGVSSRSHDVAEITSGFRAASDLQQQSQRSPGPLAGVAVAIRTWRDRRRAIRVLKQEHREAVDAARLDEILGQLHRQGAESLSDEDRQILQRMSESLRRHREADSGSDSPR